MGIFQRGRKPHSRRLKKHEKLRTITPTSAIESSTLHQLLLRAESLGTGGAEIDMKLIKQQIVSRRIQQRMVVA